MKNQKNKSNHLLLFLFCLIISSESALAGNFRVLFIGNSYTGTNNLPQLVHDAALSAGDTLNFDSNTPGGFTLVGHSQDAQSRAKIMQGNWDYVVIQGQSQEPVVYSGQFYNGGEALHDLVKQYSPCAVLMPYMTWGRKNGDAANCPFFLSMCTYLGMDSTLRNNYIELTKKIGGEVAPVSVVWRYLRQNFPSIDLYQSDESHPSLQGSYAAACSFYASIFKKDPTLITANLGLNATEAATIRSAAKAMVFDQLQDWNFRQQPQADIHFQMTATPNEVNFQAVHAPIKQTYLWNFGDGATSTLRFPSHTYTADGTYTIGLTTSICDLQGLQSFYTDTTIVFCAHTPSIYTTQAIQCTSDTLWTQVADSYQWFAQGLPIPETNRYISNYPRYAPSGFVVRSTQNGCTEQSQEFGSITIWSGYYFDVFGNPCNGDTAGFAVLHTNGFLSGSEHIYWYRNDTLLTAQTNQDTLVFSGSGKFTCKVVNPTADCPLDTTSYSISYNCNSIGIKEIESASSLQLLSNPVGDWLDVQLNGTKKRVSLVLFNSYGQLIKQWDIVEKASLPVHELPRGSYYIQVRNSKEAPRKLIKL